MQGLAKELFLKQGYSTANTVKQSTLCGKHAKSCSCSVQWLLANWQFWWWQGFKCFQLQCHTGLEGKLRKLNRFPGLACCWSWSVDCGGGESGWQWLFPSFCPPTAYLPPHCWENRESIQSQQAKQPFLLRTPALIRLFLRTPQYLFRDTNFE